MLGWNEFRKQVAAQDHARPLLPGPGHDARGRLSGCLRLLRGLPHLSHALIDRRGQVGDVAGRSTTARRTTWTGRRCGRAWAPNAWCARSPSCAPVGPKRRWGCRGRRGPSYLPSGSDWSAGRPREGVHLRPAVRRTGRQGGDGAEVRGQEPESRPLLVPGLRREVRQPLPRQDLDLVRVRGDRAVPLQRGRLPGAGLPVPHGALQAPVRRGGLALPQPAVLSDGA